MGDTEIIDRGINHLREVGRKLERYPLFLIVEDDANDAEFTSQCIDQYFERCGILTAASAEEAFIILRCFKPDYVFVDLRLPKMSGLDFIRMLHTVYPDIAPIVITGLPDDSELTLSAIKLGVVKVINKPLTRNDLEKLFTP